MTAGTMSVRPARDGDGGGRIPSGARAARAVFDRSRSRKNVDPAPQRAGPADTSRLAPEPGGGRLPERMARGGLGGEPARPRPVRGRCGPVSRRLDVSAPSPGGRRRQAGRLRRREGFTLVELAIVIAIVGFLLGAFLAPLRAQIDAARIRETERMLGEIRDALIGHAITRGALPCPDVAADGIDGTAPATCTGTALEGILPFQALGVPRADAWGRLFRYRVTQEFTSPALAGQPPGAGRLDLADAGDVVVLTRGDDPGTGGRIELKHQSPTTALVRTAPALVHSAGPNGLGGIGAATGAALAFPAGGAADEIENADADATFVSRVHSRGAAGCDDADETTAPPPPSCEFDDVVAWISTPVLMARLVEARVLP